MAVAETIMADVPGPKMTAAHGTCPAQVSHHGTGSADGSDGVPAQANGASAADVGGSWSTDVSQAAEAADVRGTRSTDVSQAAQTADVRGTRSADVTQAASADPTPADMTAAPADMTAAAETSPAMTTPTAAAAGQCRRRHGGSSECDRGDRRQDNIAHDSISTHFNACGHAGLDGSKPAGAFRMASNRSTPHRT